MTESSAATKVSCDIVVRRSLPAPVAAVWRALTEASEVVKWWGPEGYTAPSARMNVTEGGTSVVCMRSAEGEDLFSAWQYTRVVLERSLEYTFNLCDAEGHTVDPSSLGMPPGFPRNVPHVVKLEPNGSATELIFTELGYAPGLFYDLSKAGLEQCLDKLERALVNGDG